MADDTSTSDVETDQSTETQTDAGKGIMGADSQTPVSNDEQAQTVEEPQQTEDSQPQTAETSDKSDGAEKTDQSSDSDQEGENLPDNWREVMSNGDNKLLKQLQRYNTPQDFVQGHMELRRKIDSGELREPAPDPEKATQEEMDQWREKNGIPKSPEEYQQHLPEGIVPSDADQDMLNDFFSRMHQQNASPEYVQTALQSYYDAMEQQQAKRQEKDIEAQNEAVEQLRQEWGGEFNQNRQLIQNMLNANFDEETVENLYSARMPDGTPMFSDTNVLKAFASLARENYPMHTTVLQGQDNAQSIEKEISEIESKMGGKYSEYWQNPEMQERYNKLLQDRERLGTNQ